MRIIDLLSEDRILLGASAQTKEQAIDHTLKLMGWQGAEIFAIGDEVNDLPMIEAFNGYTVTTARDAIKAKARCAYESVGAMLLANI